MASDNCTLLALTGICLMTANSCIRSPTPVLEDFHLLVAIQQGHLEILLKFIIELSISSPFSPESLPLDVPN
jgi:hypothetical protein